MKRYILFILIICTHLTNHLWAQSNSNYIKTISPKIAVTTTTGLTTDNSNIAYQYFDGLGRPQQTVLQGINPDKADLVSYQEYDAYGRETNSWLPVVVSANNGAALTLSRVQTLSNSTYADNKAYSKPVYENSPLSRVLEEFGPGKDWHDNNKKLKTEYSTNTATGELACRWYRIADTYLTTEISIQSGKEYYPAYTLYVTRIIDEDNQRVTLEFKNKQEQVVLIRQINGAVYYDTHYVYDSYGNLRVVLPPMAADALTTAGVWSDTNEIIDRYAYLYKYNGRKFVTAKKLPGAGWTNYRYDTADRIIFSQDAAQYARNSSEWTFHLYDNYNRLVVMGTCSNPPSISGIAVKTDYVFWLNGTRFADNGYDTNITLSSPNVLLVNYYDNYRFREVAGFTNNTNFPAETNSGKGMLTASITTILGTTNKLYSANYYDAKGQLQKTVSTNRLNGYDKTTMTYTFTGMPNTKQIEHTASGKDAITQLYSYIYDHADRLKKVNHQLSIAGVNKGTITLAEYAYDNLGRIKEKKHHGSVSVNNKLTYNYNVRSWLTGISGGRLTQNLYYYTGNGTPQYNGNISSMTWYAGTETASQIRGYKFMYDALNRLTDAVYGEGTGITGTNYYGEKPKGYDKHGNMTGIQRWEKSGTSQVQAANYTYGYTGNQLKNLDNSATAYYEYDKNGNLNKDLYKGIAGIQYNLLNLPRRFTWNSTNYIDYGYDSTGEKRYVTHSQAGDSYTTDYCGSVIYERNVLKHILTEEGYITLSGTTPTYHYYLKDHLGNNRVVIDGTGQPKQVNHYYPFGGTFASTDENVQPYKYTGKELEKFLGLNLYDYEARHYDAVVPRFTTIDPMAEKYYSISPYAYCANNPVRFIDPDGRQIAVGNPPKNDNWWNKILYTLNEIFSFEINTRNEYTKYETVQRYNEQLNSLAAANEIIDAANDGMALVNPMASTAELFAGVQNEDYESALAAVPFVVLDVLSQGKGKFATTAISYGDFKRIENAATRLGKPIYVVGSRAEPGVVKNGINTIKGTHADWDYVIEGLSNKEYKKIRNSLPGAKSIMDNTPRNMDIFREPLKTDKPYIPIYPRIK